MNELIGPGGARRDRRGEPSEMLEKDSIRPTRRLRRLWRSERAAVAAEYALLLVLVAIAIVAALTAVGITVANLFETTGTAPPLSGGGP